MLSHPLHLDGYRIDGALQPGQLSIRRIARRSTRLVGKSGIAPPLGAMPRRRLLRGDQSEDGNDCDHREHQHASSLRHHGDDAGCESP